MRCPIDNHEFDTEVTMGDRLLQYRRVCNHCGVVSVDLLPEEHSIVLEALEAYAYWQVSEEPYRSNGFIRPPGHDDPETADHLQDIDKLSLKLGGDAITGKVFPDMKYAEKMDRKMELEAQTKPQAEAPWKETARDRLLTYMEDRTSRMLEICKAKNADYTGSALGSDDPFANFARVEALGICKTEVGFLTRMTDKLCRIASFVAKGELMVKDESVEDTLLDLANYCLLLGAFIAEQRRAKEGA